MIGELAEGVVEAIVEVIADHFAGKAVEKGLDKAGKARGWIVLGVLTLLVVGVTWLGFFLLGQNIWPIAILMFLIAGSLLCIAVASVIKGRRKRENTDFDDNAEKKMQKGNSREQKT